jgi:ribose-phosphate pyrophosphokinase
MLKPNIDLKEFILVSPDAGASKKIYKIAEQIGYTGNVITCSKDRDVNGKLTKTVVPITNEQHTMLHKGPYKDFIIIDDICDGGATFINIAKQLKANGWKNKIYLIVTHGIFSKGFKELSEYFDGIYCTNSYKDIRLNQPINDILGADPKFVKQLNVF